jgi:hypothetical protein
MPDQTLLWIGCGGSSEETQALLGVEGQALDLLDLIDVDGLRLLRHPSLAEHDAPCGRRGGKRRHDGSSRREDHRAPQRCIHVDAQVVRGCDVGSLGPGRTCWRGHRTNTGTLCTALPP